MIDSEPRQTGEGDPILKTSGLDNEYKHRGLTRIVFFPRVISTLRTWTFGSGEDVSLSTPCSHKPWSA